MRAKQAVQIFIAIAHAQAACDDTEEILFVIVQYHEYMRTHNINTMTIVASLFWKRNSVSTLYLECW